MLDQPIDTIDEAALAKVGVEGSNPFDRSSFLRENNLLFGRQIIQQIYVNPAKRMVIAVHSAWPKPPRQRKLHRPRSLRRRRQRGRVTHRRP
jgi:hypothetical protein